ncbi:MAG: tetratricopeptide repeat protein [Flavobacteriales bacterium]|nr:tetratricopeptide repeat protein [Flavobacteriales bacterium]
MDYEDYYNEGIDLKIRGEYEKSAEYHLKAIELQPECEDPEVWHNAGAALLRIDKREEAAPYLKKALAYYDEAIKVHEEEKDYYLFWKSCVYALLRDKEKMLKVLSDCFEVNDAYAIEAEHEEDFSEYNDDPEFLSIISPILKRIELLTFRGEPLSINDINSEQQTFRSSFIDSFLQRDWFKDATFCDTFESASISPQAMLNYCENANDLNLRLSLHLDTNLIFFEIADTMDTKNILMFRFYYGNDFNLNDFVREMSNNQSLFNRNNWADKIKKFIPLFKDVQFQTLDGMRVKLGLNQ